VPAVAERLLASPAEAAVLRSILRERWAEAPSTGLSRPLRPSQQTPDGDWRTWMILAGRGWGKTLTGAEDVKRYGLAHPASRIAIVAPTYADARDTCVEGESGLLSCLPPHTVANWNRSMGELILTNGTRYKLFSADEPERLRGPQHHRTWCDELGAWKYPATWDMLMFGLRLGDDPRAVVTTTPRPTPLVKMLAEAPTTHLTRGVTYENLDNLPAAFAEQIIRKYEGTRLGRQELLAEILTDVPGALWTLAAIDAARVNEHPDLIRIVVAIDPAATSTEGADETGIVVAGLGSDGHGYVLADLTVRESPAGWAGAAVAAYRRFQADRIIGEVNNGGDMVGFTVATVDPAAPFKAVHASRGKQTRAEPVASLYEQARIHHVGAFPQLEDQMTTWVPGMKSPDRMDALVWALTELFLEASDEVQYVEYDEPVEISRY
jgi:phage terminase large subunit-like protein